MNLSDQFKQKVLTELMQARQNFDGSDAAFAKQYQINNTVFSRLKTGNTTGLLKDGQWLTIGRELGVTLSERKWKIARTEVFNIIEEEVTFCKEFSKARIFVDDCGIGKTYTAKYLARTLKNCFYIDASQAKTKQQFIRLLARTLGVDDKGRYVDVIANIKYYLHVLPMPVVIIDEAGDLAYDAFLEIKELWNATENVCGWYMMGAEGFRAKIERGINNKKVGFREIFSRFSEKFSFAVPSERQSRLDFYKKLITDVLLANTENRELIPQIVRKCIIQQDGNIGGLRRAESLLILNS
jgi:hypothetical protein